MIYLYMQKKKRLDSKPITSTYIPGVLDCIFHNCYNNISFIHSLLELWHFLYQEVESVFSALKPRQASMTASINRMQQK